MLGLGSFPASDNTTFQVFQDQGRACGQNQRSVSPWTQRTAVECFSDYHVPVDASSRLPSDQFTPQEYPTMTKLHPRQLQWVSSHAHGYDVAAMSYDVETIQSAGGHHHDQLPPVSVTTSNGVWSSQFNRAASHTLVSAGTDGSGSNHPLQAFQDPTNNYLMDCPLKQVDYNAAMRPVCGQLVASSLSPFSACPPSHSDSSSYAVPSSSHSFNGGGVKSDPDGPADWHCSTLPPVWHQSTCSTTSPGQPTPGAIGYTSRSYPSTISYAAVPDDWSAVQEQKPTRITPSMSVGKTRTRDKYRTVYTENQRLELEAEYERRTYITPQRKASISAEIGLSERQIKIWFQNRRAKERKMRCRPAAKQQQQQQPVESESETNSCVTTSSPADASPSLLPDGKFFDATFYDPRMVSVTSQPTYFSTTAR